MKVQQARSSKKKGKWDRRLNEAIRRMLKQKEKAKAQLSNESDEYSIGDQNGSTKESNNNMFVHGMFDEADIGEQDEV